MKRESVLDIDSFLLEASTLNDKELSWHVSAFCGKILRARDRDQLLLSYFEKNGWKQASCQLLTCIHIDKHDYSNLSTEQKKEIIQATALVIEMRAAYNKIPTEDIREDVESISRYCDNFNKDYSDYKALETMEEYCFRTLFLRSASLPSDWIDALMIFYHNLFSYITYWCKESNIIWLNKKLGQFKIHVISLKYLFENKPDLNRVFDDFLKIDQDIKIFASTENLLECSRKNNYSSNHLVTIVSTGASIAVAATTATVSWPALVAFAIFRVVTTAANIYAGRMIDQTYIERVEHFSTLFSTMKNDYKTITIGLKSYALGRVEEDELVTRMTSERHPMLVKQYLDLESQEDRTQSEKRLMKKIKEFVSNTSSQQVITLIPEEEQPIVPPKASLFSNSSSQFFQSGTNESGKKLNPDISRFNEDESLCNSETRITRYQEEDGAMQFNL